MKNIKYIIPSEKVNMGGIMLEQPLPNRRMEGLDPFLLIHHWNDRIKVGKNPRNVGVGPHPHRGFSPVTFIFKGSLHHRDSRDHSSIVDAGGTQWMFAGRGIVHSERPSQALVEQGGDFEIIQFWVNVPAQFKMEQPEYIPLSAEDTPQYTSPDQKVKIGVITGEILGVKGAIKHPSPTTIARLNIANEGQVSLSIPPDYNAMIYVLDGQLNVNGSTAKDKDLIIFERNAEEEIQWQATADTRAILLSGQAIGEPVASYGPFVMNDQTEVMEALRDAQMGKMGVLIEEF